MMSTVSGNQVAEPEVIAPEKPEKKRKKSEKVELALMEREETAVIAHRGSQMVETLMAKAIESGNLDAMERVMAIRRELKAEAAKEAFFEAIAQFQSMVPEIPKSKKGYDYWYSPLGTIDHVIKESMEHCGLSKRWEQSETETHVTVSCVVSHVGGHSESSSIGPVNWDLLERTRQMNGLQHRGAVITYLQRYTLIAALGLSTADEDTDARGRMSPQQARETKREVRQPQMTPTAQKAANGSKERVQLEPAGESEEAIDTSTVTGLTKAMEKAALGQGDFVKRFPQLSGLEQVKFKDARVVMSWIADPTKN